MSKKYEVKDVSAEAEKALPGFDFLTRTLLWNRGIRTKKEADIFLNPDFDNHLLDPFLLPDMEKAASRILRAIKNDEKIAIWSDYDADGIPGGAMMHDFFKLLVFNNFINYIPDRHNEGYGLNNEGIEELKSSGVKLIITVDCGIRDHDEIEKANKSGIDVIITDHHEPSQTLPPAFAVVNHKRADSTYTESVLCGSGVAWKLVEAVLKLKNPIDYTRGKPSDYVQGKEKWLLDLAGLATLSDMVPLTGENRTIAHFGLKVLRKTRRPGLEKLFSILRMNKHTLTEDDVSFMITPRINAASRMGLPRDAFELLTTTDLARAESLARHLDSINHERKGVVAGIVKEVKTYLKNKFENENIPVSPVIVVGNPLWRPALLGLAANSIAQNFKRPVFLWGRDNGDGIKGSCRGDGVTDLVGLMERAKSHFLEFGGHKFSGGFSVSDEKIHTLPEALIAASTGRVLIQKENLADACLKIKDVNTEVVEEINKLAPFGIGNPKPIFIFNNVVAEKVGRFGKGHEHLEVLLREGSHTLRAIGFFTNPESWGEHLKEGMATNLAASVEKSSFGGHEEVRLRIIDFF